VSKPAKLIGRLLLSIALLALAFPALAAAADGEGIWGRATDFDITMWAFAVIALFMILPAVLSYVQHRLDTKKEREREQLERVRKP
jgi:sterol desaturase/sphingolipid hydroxylase (fatty acid hydroxylase superfamily)